MLSNQGILSNKWLLPLMVITIAAMALAFWAMMGNKASAGTPTKNAVAVGDMYLLPDTDADGAAAGWTTILDGAVDTANNHDVVAIMSMECGLHTRTKVKGKQGEEDSATASAGVMVRILINGMEMAPGEVRYCERTQELSARFGGVLEECTVDLVSGTFTSDDCTFSDEYIELMLHTINLQFLQLHQAGPAILRQYTPRYKGPGQGLLSQRGCGRLRRLGLHRQGRPDSGRCQVRQGRGPLAALGNPNYHTLSRNTEPTRLTDPAEEAAGSVFVILALRGSQDRVCSSPCMAAGHHRLRHLRR